MNAFLIVALVVLGQAEKPETTPVAAPPVPSPLFDSVIVDFEVGAAYLFQNDGRYGANGTLYSAKEVGQQNNLAVALRLAIEARIARHTVIATWAPLDLTTRTTLTRDLTFKGTTFADTSVVDHRYLFDGYRLSYLFDLVKVPRFTLGVGASVQVRNASVEFRTVDTSPAVFAVERDIGVVGALKARARFDAGILYAQADVDFFNTFGIGLRGGIHDVALTLGVPVIPGLDLLLRLRLVGGGADVPTRDIYNWGNFGFALVGLRVDLPLLWSQR
ncbi:MAG: hypothetical protein Q8N23_31470 [Archangium sp.]|nr:hypothetical protein [Archangium sp.]MDP3157234.1 hypothetical protein [Archangium sp.]MDP3576255.1 hypothetical protein [Archangium sp.]